MRQSLDSTVTDGSLSIVLHIGHSLAWLTEYSLLAHGLARGVSAARGTKSHLAFHVFSARTQSQRRDVSVHAAEEDVLFL